MIRFVGVLLLLFIYVNSSVAQGDQALNEKAVTLMEQDQYGDALAILDKLVEKNPGVTSYRYNRAVTLFALEQFSKSVADYKILFADLAEVEYLFQIANGYEQMDSLHAAVTFYSKAIGLKDDNYLTFFKRGTVFLKMNNFQNAIEDYDRSLKLNPEHHNSLHNRGIALYRIKKHDLACSDWCQAFQLGNPYSEEHLKTNCKAIPAPCN
jgi:tetratricopeptide (TPR) repeat protein